MKFALMMEKIEIRPNNFEIRMKTNNTGIPDAEVFFFVSAWLEKMEEQMKGTIKKNIQFDV